MPGDSLSFTGVLAARYKPWAATMLPYYAIFFGIACVVSMVSLLCKGTFLVGKLRSRYADSYAAAGAQEVTVRDALDQNRCAGFSAV